MGWPDPTLVLFSLLRWSSILTFWLRFPPTVSTPTFVPWGCACPVIGFNGILTAYVMSRCSFSFPDDWWYWSCLMYLWLFKAVAHFVIRILLFESLTYCKYTMYYGYESSIGRRVGKQFSHSIACLFLHCVLYRTSPSSFVCLWVCFLCFNNKK